MFNFCSISSSSSGNCLLVQSDKANVLIDVGISLKKLKLELSKLELTLDDISGILITHEHSDHCKSITSICKKHSNIPLYINKPTYSALQDIYKIESSNIHYINENETFQIYDLSITPFSIPHDAIAPCGYTICKDSRKISIATDMGLVTDNVITAISNSVFVFIESNYETEMLNTCSYPYYIKRRISSNTGHLSNVQCSDMITKLVNQNTTHFMLGHLSNENNSPDLALKTVESTLLCNNISLDNITLSVASKDSLSSIVNLEYIKSIATS